MGKSVLVVGGGIAGISAALELAECGVQVTLVEINPSIGGRMIQLDKTFPTLDCSTCVLSPKMVEVALNRNIELLTLSKPIEIEREGNKIGEGKLLNLQKNKKDIDKAKRGEEIGILYEGKERIQKGDILIFWKIEKQ